jgi:outer membrane lipoprotein-sorting protein
MASSRTWLCLLALGASACATAATIRLPDGPWAPDPLAEEAFLSASAACRGVRTLSAELAVRGTAGQARIRGRVLAGFERGGSLRLEAPAPFGAPIFILVSRANRATLLLPRDRRVLRDAPVEDVLGAITGLPRSSDDVLALVSGCLSTEATPSGAGERSPAGWMRVELAGGIRAFLSRDGAGWRIAAGHRDAPPAGGAAWSVSYSDFSSGFPAVVTIRQEPAGGAAPATALTFQVSQLETNTPIDPRAFDVVIPADAQALTLDELRQSGPLAERGRRP